MLELIRLELLKNKFFHRCAFGRELFEYFSGKSIRLFMQEVSYALAGCNTDLS